ncbi:Pollen-specific protein SF3 [Platanthera guangdongensis]|uniref:Pollen-specific protein SF3 n=1 Tax=Platanthera guangdongensis TaxID=2320717 RepID=A0ABR2LDY3_9ASPA
MAFAGTTQKCMACDKTVYLVDKLTADNRIYHKTCFRCHHCRGSLKVCGYFLKRVLGILVKIFIYFIGIDQLISTKQIYKSSHRTNDFFFLQILQKYVSIHSFLIFTF